MSALESFVKATASGQGDQGTAANQLLAALNKIIDGRITQVLSNTGSPIQP